MRFHVVALPHTNTTPEYSVCAYSQKHRRWLDMMSVRGHEVFSYGGPENTGTCVEHIPCVDQVPPPEAPVPVFDATSPLFADFNARAIEAIRDRIEPHDFVCLIGGRAQEPIADAFRDHLVVEYGIGYAGIIPWTHHVFESYSWMASVYAGLSSADQADGRFFDGVVPNYFEVDDFPVGDGAGDYLLYVGRLIERKGVQIALDVARATGRPLKVAGAGNLALPSDVEYVGVVGPEKRAELMGGARAILTPTLYLEPFGGVAVEAQLCGTPAITTDWGAFPETVAQRVSGYRCRTLAQFVQAVEDAGELDRDQIRNRAISRYSLEAVAPQYEDYFERLSTLWSDGWYELGPAIGSQSSR